MKTKYTEEMNTPTDQRHAELVAETRTALDLAGLTNYACGVEDSYKRPLAEHLGVTVKQVTAVLDLTEQRAKYATWLIRGLPDIRVETGIPGGQIYLEAKTHANKNEKWQDCTIELTQLFVFLAIQSTGRPIYYIFKHPTDNKTYAFTPLQALSWIKFARLTHKTPSECPEFMSQWNAIKDRMVRSGYYRESQFQDCRHIERLKSAEYQGQNADSRDPYLVVEGRKILANAMLLDELVDDLSDLKLIVMRKWQEEARQIALDDAYIAMFSDGCPANEETDDLIEEYEAVGISF